MCDTPSDTAELINLNKKNTYTPERIRKEGIIFWNDGIVVNRGKAWRG